MDIDANRPARASKQGEGVVISDQFASLFESSDRAERYRAQLLDFMETHVYPAEPVYDAQMRESGNPHHHPQIVEDLKSEARQRGLWNLFHPHSQGVPDCPTLNMPRSLRSWGEVQDWHQMLAIAAHPIPETWRS